MHSNSVILLHPDACDAAGSRMLARERERKKNKNEVVTRQRRGRGEGEDEARLLPTDGE